MMKPNAPVRCAETHIGQAADVQLHKFADAIEIGGCWLKNLTRTLPGRWGLYDPQKPQFNFSVLLGKAGGLELLHQAARLNPCDPRGWFTATGIGMAHFFAGQFNEAAVWTEN